MVVEGGTCGVLEALTATHELTPGAGGGVSLADLRAALEAAYAAPAACTELEYHVVPRGDIPNAVTELENFSGPFVAEHQRQGPRAAGVDNGEV